MKNKHHLGSWIWLLATFATSALMADETEIFFADRSDEVPPNVLFLIDASGSMAQEVATDTQTPKRSRMQILKDSFSTVMNDAPTNLNVGLMHYANHGLGSDYWWSSVKGVNFPISPIDGKISDAGMTDAYENFYHFSPWPKIPPVPAVPALTTPVRTFLSNIVGDKDYMGWSADGYTPIVDSLYEAARYYRGDDVGWGKGLASLGWAAHPLTYDNSISCTAYQLASGGTSTTPPESPYNPTCVEGWGECNGEVLPSTCATTTYNTCCDDADNPNDGWITTGSDGAGYCVNDNYSCSSTIKKCEHRVCTNYDTTVDLTYKSPIKYSCQANYLVLMSDGKPEYPYYPGMGEADGTHYYPPSSERYPSTTPGVTTGQAADKSSEIKVNPRLEDYMGLADCTDGAAMKDATGADIGYNSGVCGPELVKWLATEDQDGKTTNNASNKQTVKTYTVGFAMNADPSDKGEEYLRLLANEGKGEYFAANNAAELNIIYK